MADQATEAPTTGQPEGDGGQSGISGSTPWDLNSAPEELRPYLQSELKKIEGGITQKFQEAAEYRRTMEPLSGLAEIEGLADVPAEEMSELLEFRQLIQDPEQFESWWSAVGEEMGFLNDADGAGEGSPEGEADQGPPEWAQTLMERLDSLEGTTRQSEATQREQQALQQIDSQLDALREQHGDFDEDAVCQLAMSYDDEDAVEKGFADYQRLTGKAQSQLVDGASNQNGGTPVTGGSGDMSPEPVNGFDEAKKLARQRFQGA